MLLIFDLDGTLVDSLPDIAAAVNATLARYRAPPLPQSTIRTMVGDGAATLLRQAFAARGVDADPGAAVPAYVDTLAAQPVRAESPFPDVRATLDALAADGHRLALCTNKHAQAARAVLDGLGLGQRFAALCFGDTLAERKPDPAPLRHIMAGLGVRPADTLMIGDSESDAGAAHAAGVRLVLARFGYAHRPVEALGADALFARYAELPAIVAALADQALPAVVLL